MFNINVINRCFKNYNNTHYYYQQLNKIISSNIKKFHIFLVYVPSTYL